MAFGMELELRGDATSLKSTLRETKDEYRSTASEAVKSTNTMAEAAERASRHINRMEAAAAGMAGGFRTSATEAARSTSATAAAVSSSSEIFEDYANAIDSAQQASHEYVGAMDEAAAAQAAFTARTAQASDGLRNRIARAYDGIKSKVVTTFRDMRNASAAAVDAMGLDAAKINAAKDRIANASENLQRRSVRAFTAIKVAIAGLAAATVISGASFEQAIARVGAVTSATPAQIAALSTEARKWGDTTSFSAKQVAGAMAIIADSSGDAAETIAATGPVIRLAGATLLDLNEAADLVAQTLDAFNLKGQDSGRVVNVLAAAIGKVDMSSLRAGLSNVAAAAGNVGLSVEQTVAMLAILDQAGQKATKSAAGLQGIFSALLNPSDELKKLMGGLTVEANGVMAVMQQLASQGPEALSQAFDARQLQVIISLAKAGPAAFEAMTDSLTGTSRALEMFEANQKTVSSQFAILKNMVGEVMIAAFQELSGVALTSIGSVQAAVAKYKARIVEAVASARDWVVAHKDQIASVVELALKIGPVVIGIGLMLKAIREVVNVVATARAVLLALRVGFVAIVPVINTVSTAMGGVAIATSSMAGPVGIAILAITGLVMWMQRLRNEANEAAKVIPNTLAGVVDELGAAEMQIARLRDKISENWEAKSTQAYHDELVRIEQRVELLRVAHGRMTVDAVKGLGDVATGLLGVARGRSRATVDARSNRTCSSG